MRQELQHLLISVRRNIKSTGEANLLPDLKVARFRSSTHIKKGSVASLTSLVRSFVNDPSVSAALGTSPVDIPDEISVSPLSCTVLNMNFFDAVAADNEVVTSTDLIRACMDETFDGITIQDKLREMLVNPDSENCHLFEEAQKKEWIYHLLKLVCVGGAMCQAEDKFAEYKEITKTFYKDTVSVQKDKILAERFGITPSVSREGAKSSTIAGKKEDPPTDVMAMIPAPVQIFIDRFLKAGVAVSTLVFVLAGVAITLEAYAAATHNPLPTSVDSFIVSVVEPNFTPGLLVLLGFSVSLGVFTAAQLGSEGATYRE
ncbi:hypothetical protein TrRE_jg7571 [Triparma retinervis]|uniref:Cilia- and flagella-associated protein 300 n=1 Tax=Triparma retinervis TaxID=2557542 RepID=A0A9W7AMX5_9STRA|nr:hypothetical protein TrRE_jg7571 [Triparma retinervis]